METLNKQYLVKETKTGEKIYVRDIQLKIMEILREFDRVCQKNNIEYVLAYGSMLGAIRHQGFIPWDDDLDVLVDYNNYLKLLEVLDRDLDDAFYYHCFENDTRYNITIPAMKIRMKNTYIKERNFLLSNKCEGNGLFMDVFIFDKISESKLNHAFHKTVSLLFIPPMILLDNIGINPVIFKKGLYKYARWYATKNKDSKDAYLSLTWPYDNFSSRLRYDDMFPAVRVPFEDGLYPVGNNFDACLKATYGENYMTPPPENKRFAKHTADLNLHGDLPE